MINKLQFGQTSIVVPKDKAESATEFLNNGLLTWRIGDTQDGKSYLVPSNPKAPACVYSIGATNVGNHLNIDAFTEELPECAGKPKFSGRKSWVV